MQDHGWHGVEGLRFLMYIYWMTASERLEAASGAGTCNIYYVRIDGQPVVESMSTTEAKYVGRTVVQPFNFESLGLNPPLTCRSCLSYTNTQS